MNNWLISNGDSFFLFIELIKLVLGDFFMGFVN